MSKLTMDDYLNLALGRPIAVTSDGGLTALMRVRLTTQYEWDKESIRLRYNPDRIYDLHIPMDDPDRLREWIETHG